MMNGWLTATSIIIPPVTSLKAHALFVNTGTKVYQLNGVVQPKLPPPGIWIPVDLTPSGVPVNAVAVDLRGILVITDGSTSQDTSLAMSFQAPGAGQDVGNYVIQASSQLITGGAREPASVIVPCVNGVIEYSWYRGNSNGEWPTGTIPDYPVGAAYGFNLNIQAIFIP